MKMPRFEKIVARIKNNQTKALIIAVGTAVIALSTFTDATMKLFGTIGRLFPPAPINISGKWRADETDKTPLTSFDFKVVDDKLYGTVWISPSFYMQNGESGILNGRIIGNRVSFTTQHEYIKEFGDSFKGIPAVTGELVTTYKGEIKGDEIRFARETEGGYYAEITAKKIIDLTETTSKRTSAKEKNTYTLVYTLPGHAGGVRSLSFGPDQGRFRSGGLRLASAGVKDGKIKYWDVATAEAHGDDDFMSDLQVGTSASSTVSDEHISTDNSTLNPNEEPIYLAYSPKTREGGVDLTAVGVSPDRRVVKFYSWYFWPAGGSGGGGSTKEVLGTIGLVGISGDSYVIATDETEGTAKFTINIRNTSGDMQRTLNCEGIVTALALSVDGKLLASAEAMESKETTIKMWDTATGGIIRRISSQRPVSHLTISADGSLLASGGDNDGQIRIWDTSNGSMKFVLSAEPDKGVSFLLFSNTGKLLASAGVPSATIKLWNASTGTLDHALDNEGTVGILAFSHGDRLLASGDRNEGTIKVWGKPTSRKIKEMRER